jgi:hypothetical protein
MAALFDRSVSAPGVLFPVSAFLVHNLPGRLRFVLPDLKGGGPSADALRALLEPQTALRDVTFRAAAGSLVVIYDVLPGARDNVLDVLRAADVSIAARASCQASTSPRRVGPGKPLADTPAKAALHFVVEHALQGAIAAIV